MSQNIECTECHDLVTLEGGRVITVPFICRVCVASSDAKPLQARPGLVIQECDNIACDCLTLCRSALSTIVSVSSWRLRFVPFEVRMWRLNVCPRLILPVPVLLETLGRSLMCLQLGHSCSFITTQNSG